MNLKDLNELLKVLVKSEASDLHIGAGMVPSFRLYGKIVPITKEAQALKPPDVQTMIFRLLSQELQGKLQEAGELDFSFGIPGVGRFRCNIHRQRGTWAGAFRKIPMNIPTMDALGMPEAAQKLVTKESGLVLITGPSGSGKSMTLAAMIEFINANRRCHVITLEDPIEFVFKNKKSIVKQREIGTDTSDYEMALKNIFRQDPDVIVIGEMKDFKTVSTGLALAGTGRLVFGVMHTMDAVSTVNRIIESFPAEQQSVVQSQLAGCLEGVIAQQLCLRADNNGRALATELLITTPSVRNLIRTGKIFQIQNDMDVGKRFGMQTMTQSLQDLVVKETVKLEEALRHTRDPESLIQRVGVPK